MIQQPSTIDGLYANGEIIKVLWEMKKNGLADATIKNVGKALKLLDHHCNLNKPETVKTFITTIEGKNGYKGILCSAYDKYVKIHGLQWTKPKYRYTAKMPRIPTEAKINCIIANSFEKLATAITMSKDTGLRPIELTRLKLRDIDLQKRAVYPETAKNGSPRVLKLKNSTINMLNKYVAKNKIGLNEKIFGYWNTDIYGKFFRQTRNKTAKKMSDNSIKAIRLYDLRHFFATMLYAKTKDILFVMQQMGHKNIKTTLIYTQLLQFDKDDNYTCKVAEDIKQATELIENGFEYITEMDGLKLFRKRK